MLRFLVILVLGVIGLLVVFVVGCLVYGTIRAKTLKYQVVTIEGKVVRKEFNGDEVFKIGDKIHRVPMEDEYLVFVHVDGGKEIEIDDADLFDRVNVGETIELEQHRGYDKKGTVRHEYYEPVK